MQKIIITQPVKYWCTVYHKHHIKGALSLLMIHLKLHGVTDKCPKPQEWWTKPKRNLPINANWNANRRTHILPAFSIRLVFLSRINKNCDTCHNVIHTLYLTILYPFAAAGMAVVEYGNSRLCLLSILNVLSSVGGYPMLSHVNQWINQSSKNNNKATYVTRQSWKRVSTLWLNGPFGWLVSVILLSSGHVTGQSVRPKLLPTKHFEVYTCISNIFSLSALTLLVRRQEGHLACK